MWQLFEKNF